MSVAGSERPGTITTVDPSRPATDNTLTVQQVCATAKQAIRQHFPGQTWVTGRIASKKTNPGTGHRYLDLVAVDANNEIIAKLGGVCFATAAETINRRLAETGGQVKIENGVEVRVRGTIEIYPHRATLQIKINDIDPAWTLERVHETVEQIVERLRQEEILHKNNQHPIPKMPLRIGVVTSQGSAAYHDFCDELTRSGYPFDIRTADARVQGTDATQSITDAIAAIHALDEHVNWTPDIVAIIRGGGARTDLAAFDDEKLARLVARAPWPVFAGIGHETDTTVVDAVAHTRFKTPTAAAAGIVAACHQSHSHTLETAQRLTTSAAARLATAAETAARRSLALHAATERQLDHVNQRLERATDAIDRAPRTIDRAAAHLAQTTARFARAATSHVNTETTRLAAAAATIEGADPTLTMRRGWIYVRHDNTLITNFADLAAGDHIHLHTLAGTVPATITAKATPT